MIRASALRPTGYLVLSRLRQGRVAPVLSRATALLPAGGEWSSVEFTATLPPDAVRWCIMLSNS